MGPLRTVPDELHTRAPVIWCTAGELATLAPGVALVRAFRRHSDAVARWRDEHDGRHPCEGMTLEQRREAQRRALASAMR